MKNWSENQKWEPKKFLQPKSSNEIISIVKYALENNQKIRVYGSKISFSSLNNTDDISLNLDNYQGIINIDKENHFVTVKSGTKLFKIIKILSENGLALENMGDFNKQSVAGAIATATHGSGIYLGILSTQVVGIKFINGLGEEIYCSEKENLEVFKCMQTSLGALGIVTEITLTCVNKYKLKLDKFSEKISSVLLNVNDYNANNRNFELLWFPYTDTTLTKYSNVTNFKADKSTFYNFINDYILENYIFTLMCNLTKWFPNLRFAISKFISLFILDSVRIKQSEDIYITPKNFKFNEMEYSVPIDAYQDVMKDVIKLVNSKKFDVFFPVQNRFVAEDNIYLSPCYKRVSAYISCHMFKGKNYITYFKALEEIFSAYQGRPHWGKIHFKKQDYFASVYPMFTKFKKIRNEQDPYQLFLNKHLTEILT